MSTEITLDRLAAANPAPEHGLDIDDSMLLLAIQERSVAMSTNTERKATRGIQRLDGSEPPKRKTGLIVALTAFAVVMIVGLVTLIGSTSTDSPPAVTPTTAVSTPPQPETEAVAVPRTIEIKAFDYGYSGFDTEFRVGDALELVNTSDSEYHALIVISVGDGYPVKTIEDVVALEPRYINEVLDSWGRRLHAAPGTKADGRIRLQTPGTYIALDWMPQNADPEVMSRVFDTMVIESPFTVAGGPLGYQHGMIVKFEVVDN